MSISQEEFQYLIDLEKEFSSGDELILGPAPMSWSRDIFSTNKDAFILDFRRGSIELKKYTLNKRYRNVIILLRYDALGRHTNPPGTDDKAFDGAHVHLYREGFDDKWAFPVSEIGLSGSEPMEEIVVSVLDYCNVKNHPRIKQSLF